MGCMAHPHSWRHARARHQGAVGLAVRPGEAAAAGVGLLPCRRWLL